MYFIGLDVGGTKVEAMLFEVGEKKNSNGAFEIQKSNGNRCYGHLLSKKRIPTERHSGYSHVVDKISTLVKDLCAEKKLNLTQLAGIGLSVPGPVDPRSGVINMSNSMIMSNRNLATDLKQKLSLTCPMTAENDANCFALAEALCGAGLEYNSETGIPVAQQTAVGIILGSGCGGGIILGGKMLTGKRGGGGEVGHLTLYSEGHPCYCGRRGCAEQYLCGPALEAALNTRLYSQIEKRPTAQEIFELYQAQDPVAIAVVKQYRHDLAKFLGTLACVLDPHYFVLGGGLSLQSAIYEGLEAKLAEHTYLSTSSAKVYQHKIGDSAGALGAVLFILEKEFTHV